MELGQRGDTKPMSNRSRGEGAPLGQPGETGCRRSGAGTNCAPHPLRIVHGPEVGASESWWFTEDPAGNFRSDWLRERADAGQAAVDSDSSSAASCAMVVMRVANTRSCTIAYCCGVSDIRNFRSMRSAISDTWRMKSPLEPMLLVVLEAGEILVAGATGVNLTQMVGAFVTPALGLGARPLERPDESKCTSYAIARSGQFGNRIFTAECAGFGM